MGFQNLSNQAPNKSLVYLYIKAIHVKEDNFWRNIGGP